MLLRFMKMGLQGDSDSSHLARATALVKVLVTADTDFLRMVAEGVEHTGIVFAIQGNHSIGNWVNKLELICIVYNADSMKNHVEYL